MQYWIHTLTGTICGAIVGVAAVIVLTNTGFMPINESRLHAYLQNQPINETKLRAYLLSHPQLVAQMTDAEQRIEDVKTAETNAVALKKIGLSAFFDPKIAFVSGPADAKNTMVEIYDYDCPFCRMSNPEVQKFREVHKTDTRYALIELPLSIHGPDAQFAARLSVAARKQSEKYLALHFALMGTEGPVDQPTALATAKRLGFDMAKLQSDMKIPETDKILASGHDLLRKAGIAEGTPTFIVNGVIYPNALNFSEMQEAIKDN